MSSFYERRQDAGRPHPEAGRGAPSGASAIRTFSGVQLSIYGVTCEKSTSELGQDEMKLTAIATVPSSQMKDGKKVVDVKSKRAKTVDLGKFKKGDQRSFPQGQPLAEFPLASRQAHWPVLYLATLVMIETDKGKGDEVIAAVVNAVDQDVERFVSTQAGVMASMAVGAAVGSPIPFIGPLAGALAGAAAGGVLAALKKARNDDALQPKPVELALQAYPDKTGELPGSRHVVRIEGRGGVYSVRYGIEIV